MAEKMSYPGLQNTLINSLDSTARQQKFGYQFFYIPEDILWESLYLHIADSKIQSDEDLKQDFCYFDVSEYLT